MSLLSKYAGLKKEGSYWLANQGVKLYTNIRSSGYSGTGGDAYGRGRSDGASSGFGRKNSNKLLK
jgi:hypothetical protein